MAKIFQPVPAVLSSLSLQSFRRNSRFEVPESSSATVLASGTLQGVTPEEPMEVCFLVTIDTEDTRHLLLGAVEPVYDESGPDDQVLSLPPGIDLGDLPWEEGWMIGPMSTRSWKHSPDAPTPAVRWGVDFIGEQKLLYGAVDMTGLARTLAVDVNGAKYQAPFSDGAAVLYIKVDPSADSSYRGSKAVLDAGGAVIAGERFDYGM